MTLSQFWQLMDTAFGHGYSRSLAKDHVLGPIGYLTITDAFAAGVPIRDVWEAICEDFDLPPELRWYSTKKR